MINAEVDRACFSGIKIESAVFLISTVVLISSDSLYVTYAEEKDNLSSVQN